MGVLGGSREARSGSPSEMDPTRRTFLKGIAATGAALYASGLLAGCDANGSAEGTSSQGSNYQYETHEADVVVVGGGVAGMFAARNALSKGQRVMLIDKGPFGHSGASGINWGHATTGNDALKDFTDPYLWGMLVTGTEGLVDQQYYFAMAQASAEQQFHSVAQKLGCVWDRKADGTTWGYDYPFITVRENLFPRLIAQHIRQSGVKVLDRTMVLDVLKASDGSAAGIVALDLVDGTAVVVRCKAVVMATGSCCWCNGWSGVGAKSNAGLENTGDGLAILTGHGVPVSGWEQWALYMYNVHPDGIAFSQNIGVSAGDHPENVINAEGEHVFTEDNAAWSAFPQRATYDKLIMKEVYEGRGTENGGLLYDITQISEPEYMMAFNRRQVENQVRGLGYQAENPSELVPSPWEIAARPDLNAGSETVIPGLFFAAAQYGAYSGSAGYGSFTSGHLAGGAAAERAATVDRQDISHDTVQEVLGTAYGFLGRDPSQGKRANDIQHAIQNVVSSYLFVGRSAEGLETAIAELERIKAEDMPAMYVTDSSRHFNYEWRQAMEVPFMWTCGMAIAQAALARTETRGSHHRLDYPEMDNTNWLKNVWVTSSDGTWSTEAKDIVATFIPANMIPTIVPEIGIGGFPQS